MNLMPVITWLENGCDPKEAAKELRIYQAKEDCASELCDQARQAILAGKQDTALALLNDIANQAAKHVALGR